MSAEQLQSCLDRIAAGESVESVLRALDADAETRALVQLALAAGEALPMRAPSAMRARQQAALQARLLAEDDARRDLRSAAGLAGAWRRIAVRLAGAALAASLALGSAVAVSADSVPGDALYGVKRAAESARVALTVSPASRVRLRASMATERLAELRALVDRGVMPSPEAIEDLLRAHEAMRDALSEPGAEALAAETARRSDDLAEGLRDLAEAVAPVEPALAARLDEAAQRVAPPAAAREQEPGGRDRDAEGSGGEGSVGGESSDAAEMGDEATSTQPARGVADTPVPTGVGEATAMATSTTAPTITPRTATATPLLSPSPTLPPVATATSGREGGGPVPTEPPPPPPATSVPATQPPPPVPPTDVPPTTAPATQPPPPSTVPNPRATRRSATNVPPSQP